MNAQSSHSEQPTTPENARGRFTLRPTERAFVIQFEPLGGARSRLRGRIELVGTGEAMRFRSLKQLVGFMVSTLRKRAAAAPLE